MLSDALSAALALGLAGGMHCATMCGPLAIGASCARDRFAAKPALEYLGGRFLAYTLLGAAFGGLGQLLDANVFSRARLAGVLLVAVIFCVKGLRLLRVTSSSSSLVQLRGARRRSFFSLLPLPSRGLALGLFTGLLPCGLLYGGFGLAASTASPIGGALVMSVLAGATLPGLFAPVLLRGALDRRFPQLRSPRFQGVMWCALGLWLSFGPVVEIFASRSGGCHG